MTPFKIQVTEEIIHQCKDAGVPGEAEVLGNVCPIATTIKDMFPDVYVANEYLFPYGQKSTLKIKLPQIARNFINLFDSLCMMPNVRLKIPAFEFEIEIPEEVIEKVSIENVMADYTNNNTKSVTLNC